MIRNQRQPKMMNEIAGLDLLMPGCPKWTAEMAEVIHQNYLIVPDQVIVSGKNIVDPQFRSVEHSVSFTCESSPAQVNQTKFDLTTLLLNQGNYGFLAKYFPGISQATVAQAGTEIMVNGVATKLVATLSEELKVPSHALAGYIAGYSSMVFVRTLPETILSDQAAAAIKNRVDTAQSMIINSIWLIFVANVQTIEAVPA
jgi:hypothetical protein